MLDEVDFEARARAAARASATAGLGLLAQALNHCKDDAKPYRYGPDAQREFLELACRLVAIVETGEIERNAGHARHQLASAAREDQALQRMLQRAAKKTPIRK